MISPYASPTEYGWHSRTHTIAKELTNRGHQVTVFAFSGSQYLRLIDSHQKKLLAGSTEEHDGVAYRWFGGVNWNPTNPLIRLLNWKGFNRKVAHWIRQYKGEAPEAIVISSPTVTPALLIPELKHRFPLVRMVFEIRDIWPLSLELLGGYRPSHPVMRWLRKAESIAVETCDSIIGLMPGVADYLHQSFGEKISAKSMVYIPHTVEMEEKEPLLSNEDSYFLGYAGTLGKANDVGNLLDALHLLKAQGITPKTLIIGEGISESHFRRAIQPLDNVDYLPWAPREKVLSKLANCDVCFDGFLDIGLYQYGFSRLKWADYMMLGKPILASYSGQAYELPMDKIGWIVPASNPESLAQEIARIYKQSTHQDIAEKGRNGKHFLKTQRSTQVLVNAYERAIFGK